MGGRVIVVIALAGALSACGGKTAPAPTTTAPAAGEEQAPAATAPKPTPAPLCPDLTATLRGQSDDELLEDFEAVIRVCVPGHFGGQPCFLAFGSIGPASDPESQSEEGWTLHTFVAGADGNVLATAPVRGASWMTGVPEPTFRLTDLDADGTDEVIEVVDEAISGPDSVSKVLRVYRRNGAELKQVLQLALEHQPAELEQDGSQACKASFEVAGGGVRVTARAAYDHSDYEEAPYWIGDDLIDAVWMDPYERTDDLRCLADGVYDYRLKGDVFEVSRQAP